MSNKNIEAYIKCPFYKSENCGKTFAAGGKRTPARITCEGYHAGSEVTMLFRGKADRRKHLVNNCFSVDGGNCFLARCLYFKYAHPEEDEKGNII